MCPYNWQLWLLNAIASRLLYVDARKPTDCFNLKDGLALGGKIQLGQNKFQGNLISRMADSTNVGHGHIACMSDFTSSTFSSFRIISNATPYFAVLRKRA